jgi:hypothetical protein
MSVTIDGTGTVTGLSTGGLPDGSIAAADLATDAVTGAKIADDAITLAKMASGTDGNIISYDASGNPVAIATGSSGQVLTSGGAGAAPSFAAAATTNAETLATVWVNFNGNGTLAIRNSFNVSSVTDNGTGSYTVNFASALADVNYSAHAECGRDITPAGANHRDANCDAYATGSVKAYGYVMTSSIGALSDHVRNVVTIHGGN